MRNLTLMDLDVLLDTRLGAICQINEQEVPNVLNNGWHDRLSYDIDDVTTAISNKAYHKAYDNRSLDTLKLSRVTNIVKSLAFENKRSHLDIITPGNLLEDWGYVINTHPYNLTLEDEYAIKLAMSELLGGDPPIKFTRFLPHSTRLGYLEMNGFTDYITYDIDKWIVDEFNHCKKEDDFTHCPNITVWGPKLLQSKSSLFNVLKEHSDIDERDSPFEITRTIFAACVRLEFIPVSDFSVFTIDRA